MKVKEKRDMMASVLSGRVNNLSPAQALMSYFASAILFGTLLLATPWALNGAPSLPTAFKKWMPWLSPQETARTFPP